jgi:hypothetical protein
MYSNKLPAKGACISMHLWLKDPITAGTREKKAMAEAAD